jgi:replicative DNA helicase
VTLARTDVQTPPHDAMAEAATLSACMLKPEVAASALAIASPEDFFSGASRAVALSVAELVAGGAVPDMTAVGSRLRSTGRLALVGGESGLIDLVNAVPAIGQVERYAATVRDLARVRRLQATLHGLLAESYEPLDDVGGYMARVDHAIGEHTRAVVSGGAVSALEASKDAARALMGSAKPRVMTGFPQLDRVTTGLEGSRLYVVGGRTGMGKSAFAGQLALSAALAGKVVLYASLEMPAGQLMTRLICAESRVPLGVVRDRRLDPGQMSRFTHKAAELARLPLHIDATTSQTVLHIRASMRRVNADVVIVDHLGLVKPAGYGSRKRHELIGEITRGLKALAMETDKPVVALCQVSREVAKDGARPGLHHLRESGDIEQDADTVILLHRPGYFDPSRQGEGEAEVIVAKQRDGETASIPCTFDGQSVSFREASDV